MITSVVDGDVGSAKEYASRLAADAVITATADTGKQGPLTGTNVQDLEDGRLTALMADSNVQASNEAADAVLGELDRRSAAAYQLVGQWSEAVLATAVAMHDPAPESMPKAHGAAHKAKQWATAAELLDRGLVGSLNAKTRRIVRDRYGVADTSADGRMRQLRADWTALCYDQLIQAHADCGGKLLTDEAAARGATAKELWSRPWSWVKANATPEFLQWQDSHVRVTLPQYVAAATAGLDSTADDPHKRAAR